MDDPDRRREPDLGDPSALMNDVLLGFFVPGVLLFVGLFVLFRTGLGDVVASIHPVFAEPITPAEGRGAVATGLPRFLLLIVLTAALLVPYLGVYARFLRPALGERGWV